MTITITGEEIRRYETDMNAWASEHRQAVQEAVGKWYEAEKAKHMPEKSIDQLMTEWMARNPMPKITSL